MRKLLYNPFTNPDTAGQVVRKIAVQAVALMLFLTTISCEKTEKIEFYPEILSGEFFIFQLLDPSPNKFVLHNGRSSWDGGINYFTINLPKEFQQSCLLVTVTYRRTTRDKIIGSMVLPIMEIITIEESIFTSRFVISYHDDCGFLLFEDLGDESPLVYIPINLPEEFQKDGLRVNVTFHRRAIPIVGGQLLRCGDHHVASMKIITIMETPEKSLSAETRIEDDHDAAISNNPWQVFLTQTLSNNISPFKLSSI